MNNKTSIESLKKMISLIEQLRGENGCPWVKKQTFIKHFDELKKEVQEVEDAIGNGDKNNIEEELGDVLWDVLMLIKISEDEYGFKLEDLIDVICKKMIRRKPYIFGDEKAGTPEEAVKIWKRVKEEEKKSF